MRRIFAGFLLGRGGEIEAPAVARAPDHFCGLQRAPYLAARVAGVAYRLDEHNIVN